jgi:hypothetical protein
LASLRLLVRQAALEEAIDLAHLTACGDFAIDRAQRGQHVLAQIPERFEVAGEANTLSHPLNRMAAVDLQQRQHCSADLAHLAIRGTARAEAGKGQKAEEPAEGQHCEEGGVAGSLDGCLR